VRNIELKARLLDYARAQALCEELGAVHQGLLHQIDTYFSVPRGRLKHRHVIPGEDYLVFYERPDTREPRACDYHTTPATDALREILAAALGVMAVVNKKRDLWLWKNVRIHLDDVEQLGRFMEFEAVLSGEFDENEGFEKVARLRDAFELDEARLLETSYLDMVLDDRNAL